MNLQGFSSDDPSIVAQYKIEADLSRSTADLTIDRNYPESFLDYIFDKFAEYQLDQELQSAIEEYLG